MRGWRRQRSVVDQGRAVEARLGQQGLHRAGGAVVHGCLEPSEQGGLDVEQATAVGHEQVLRLCGFDQMSVRKARARRLDTVQGVGAAHFLSFALSTSRARVASRPPTWNLSQCSQRLNRSS